MTGHDMAGRDWQRIWAVFEEAISRPENERAAIVASACAGDADLARAVEQMLEAADEEDALLDRPLFQWPSASDIEPDSETREASAPSLQEIGSLPAGGEIKIGSYQIERVLGQGGMSTVYLAHRSGDGQRRRVVVKVVRRGMERSDVLARLRAERKILAGLEHPNIARLYDGGATDDGLPFFVMEYVDGQPIDRYCENRELSVEQRVALFREVCAAVQYAHQNLVVHRDLKASNILVTRDGRPKLLDFGIAKVLDPEAWDLGLEPTVTANRMLTPSCASPEQFRGDPLSTASDVYSLGVLFYGLLAGGMPFEFAGLSPAQVERMIATTEPEPPSAALISRGDANRRSAVDLRRQAKTLEGDLDAIVLKALRGDPEDRYGSAEQLGLELDRYLRGLPVEARQGTLRYRMRKLIRRHRAGLAIVALIALLLVGGGVALAIQSNRAARERDQARLERDQKGAVIDLFENLVAAAEPLRRQGSDLTVQELLVGNSSSLIRALRDQPLVAAQLLHTSGSMLSQLDALPEAREQLERSLALRRENLGDRHPDTATTECELAKVLWRLGDLEAAETLARQSVATLRAVPDVEVTQLADAFSALVNVLWSRHNVVTTQALAREARDLVEESGELTGGHTSETLLQLLAAIEIRNGQYDRAAALLREALTVVDQRYGEQSPQRAGLLNDLALALRWLGDLEAAEAAYDEALKLTLATYGRQHSEYVLILNNIGGLRFARGDFDGAASAYKEAQEIFLELRPDHWRVFFLETNIQAARMRQGQVAQAASALQAARDHWSTKLEADFWVLAQADSLLGEAAALQGQDEQAERLLTESLRRLIEVQAKDRYLRKALERLSTFLDSRGREDEVAAWQARLPTMATSSPPG